MKKWFYWIAGAFICLLPRPGGSPPFEFPGYALGYLFGQVLLPLALAGLYAAFTRQSTTRNVGRVFSLLAIASRLLGFVGRIQP